MAQVSPLEERTARIEGILEELRNRVSRVEIEISGLRQEMVGLRQEMVGEISALRQEMRGEISALRQEMVHEISALRQEMVHEISELRLDMRSAFRWTIGIMLGIFIPMWVSIILAILFST